MAMLCCPAWRSQPTIFISASFVPSLLVGYRKVYSVRCEADVVMTSGTLDYVNCPDSSSGPSFRGGLFQPLSLIRSQSRSSDDSPCGLPVLSVSGAAQCL